MKSTTPAEPRRAAIRYSVATIGVVCCLFGWVALLSFDVADAPATVVWPRPAHTHNLCGPVGAALAYRLFYHLGHGAYAALGVLTLGMIALSRGALWRDLWIRFLGAALATSTVSAASGMFLPPSDTLTLAGPGGVLGTWLGALLTSHFQLWGGGLVLLGALLIGLLLAFDEYVIRLARWMGWMSRKSGIALRDHGGQLAQAGAGAFAAAGTMVANGVASVSGRLATAAASTAGGSSAATDDAATGPTKPRSARQLDLALADLKAAADDDDAEDYRYEEDVDDAADDVEDTDEEWEEEDEDVEDDIDEAEEEADEEEGDEEDEEVEWQEEPEVPVTARRPTPAARQTPSAPARREDPRPKSTLENYTLPPLNLLEEAPPVDKRAIEMLCREKAFTLEQTLNEFRLEVQVVSIETGPVITVFELKLAPGIKVSQIASLTNDMARALKAPAVRVVAPLPGRNTVGIEVPNIDKEKVRLKDIMQGFGKRADSLAIPLYLGKDASGAPLVSDMTRMPHMLIAGTTGSGKSVCISSIILSILMTRSPADVKLILVDPKVVELAMFKDIPHLMCPIITEMSKAEGILDWAATKMDERYALLAEAGVKDIRSYNRLGIEGLKERLAIEDESEMAHIPVNLPYIVIVIDELADLMMTAAKEVEYHLCRLAQKSRAVGIHLIVSTQRPQANVVTGLIKSNLPSRIAFRVSSRLDSRIVLDQNGGEVLMGQGDMLFLPPGQSKLMRAQGTFIDDDELRAIVRQARAQGEPEYHPELLRAPKSASSDVDRDELFDQAVDIIIQTGRGSVSLLQRRLTVGYGRASRLIDQMYEAGIVGEYKGSQAREVLVTADEWSQIRQTRDREEAGEAAEMFD